MPIFHDLSDSLNNIILQDGVTRPSNIRLVTPMTEDSRKTYIMSLALLTFLWASPYKNIITGNKIYYTHESIRSASEQWPVSDVVKGHKRLLCHRST